MYIHLVAYEESPIVTSLLCHVSRLFQRTRLLWLLHLPPLSRFRDGPLWPASPLRLASIPLSRSWRRSLHLFLSTAFRYCFRYDS